MRRWENAAFHKQYSSFCGSLNVGIIQKHSSRVHLWMVSLMDAQENPVEVLLDMELEIGYFRDDCRRAIDQNEKEALYDTCRHFTQSHEHTHALRKGLIDLSRMLPEKDLDSPRGSDTRRAEEYVRTGESDCITTGRPGDFHLKEAAADFPYSELYARDLARRKGTQGDVIRLVIDLKLLKNNREYFKFGSRPDGFVAKTGDRMSPGKKLVALFGTSRRGR